jgi:WhiB family transcriptional regulator, redox-sensing transcriptional regulator
LTVADVVVLMPRWTQQDWMAEARCKGQTHLFFAPFGEPAEPREAREALARSICMACPVLEPCRDWARRHREQGFWGGENDEQRNEVRKRAQRGRTRPQPAAAHGGLDLDAAAEA